MKAKILNFNQVDEKGDIFQKGQIRFKNPVIVLKDFDNSKILFKVEVEENEDGLYAEFPEDEEIKGLFPAIGYQTVKGEEHFELFAIGLCFSHNMDPKIMPL